MKTIIIQIPPFITSTSCDIHFHNTKANLCYKTSFSLLLSRFFACLVTVFVTSTLSFNSVLAQEVKISRDINIRNDYAYDLFYLKDQVYFFRDKGFEYYFDVFDKEMNYKRTQEIKLAERRHFIENIMASDSTIHIVFSFKEQDSFFIKSVTYSDRLIAIDTQTLIRTTKAIGIGEFRSVASEDHSKLLLFHFENDKIHQLVLDVKNALLLSYNELKIPEYTLKDHFVDVAVSDDGHLMYLFEKNNNSWDKEKHFMRLVSAFEDKFTLIDISCTDIILSDVKMAVDNGNGRLSIASLWGENNETETEGYILFSKDFEELSHPALYEITAFYYDEDILKDLNGVDKKSKKNYLYDFYLRNIIHRADGGVVLITELQREFTRRNAGLPNFDRSVLPAKGYVDYYHEDLILYSMDSKGALSWRKILFKKQFSQDDEGIYSSFLIMKLPSQLRIIFNDEIKNNNTVSEYVIDPLGNFKRNSILSTEYKNLKLRMQAGIQTSSNAIVVPSEKNSKINLVKVVF